MSFLFISIFLTGYAGTVWVILIIHWQEWKCCCYNIRVKDGFVFGRLGVLWPSHSRRVSDIWTEKREIYYMKCVIPDKRSLMFTYKLYIEKSIYSALPVFYAYWFAHVGMNEVAQLVCENSIRIWGWDQMAFHLHVG
ncbi:hypothetical protein BDB01DRAFT_834468 [Pilobolus umbonatus]|nr:hypothetical protein BDB01DRAFT_834468 [Pilobolus umbonatus]